MSGSNYSNPAGSYGTKGVAAAGNVPGARFDGASWTDLDGNFWLFGGEGCVLVGNAGLCGELNDLWEYNPTTGIWIWVSGSNQDTNSSPAATTGVYGTLGVAAASNIPGARTNAVSWTDHAGNLWLFGGIGVDSTGSGGDLNDLWEYDSKANVWTWMGGSNLINAQGIYGVQGVAAAANMPGARAGAVGWTDSSGNFWLFGGSGIDSTSAGGDLNDLWEFNPTAKTWTWISGSNAANSPGVYGTKGVAAASNIPTPRWDCVGWTDSSGNLWLFGGFDINNNLFNDLWEYSPKAKTWTWVSGSSTTGGIGVYGTKGVAAASNVPGARMGIVNWVDSSGDPWLFGGEGYDSTGGGGALNDLWKFSPKDGTWTWMSGSDTSGASGDFGTKGVAATNNMPSARYGSFGWTDSDGSFWLFGSGAYQVEGTIQVGLLNDLWRCQP
jgi:N-acetylneuraminic acid mutarotase